jgi:hypothetical protein
VIHTFGGGIAIEQLHRGGRTQRKLKAKYTEYLGEDEANRTQKMRALMEHHWQISIDNSFANNPDARGSMSSYVRTIGCTDLAIRISKG